MFYGLVVSLCGQQLQFTRSLLKMFRYGTVDDILIKIIVPEIVFVG